MARRYPKLCGPRRDGRYYATDPLTGKPTYFGRDAPEAARLYDAWISRLAQRRAAPQRGPKPGTDPSVAELLAAFLDDARSRYAKHGRPTKEFATHVQALRFLGPYLDLPVSQFSADELILVRDAMLAHRAANGSPYTRYHVNRQVGRVVNVFRWGRQRRLVPKDVLADLREVEPLRRGRTAAPDNPPVPPVPEADALATAAKLSPQYGAMVRLMLASGMRPGEACSMKGEQIDRSAVPWVYRPAEHKTEHHGIDKVIYLGPRAREILTPLLAKRPTGWTFPARYSFGKRPTRPVGLWKATQLAAQKAGVPAWHPNQCRHTAGTRVRTSHGIEGAQAALGHEHVTTTEKYACKDDALARRVAEETG